MSSKIFNTSNISNISGKFPESFRKLSEKIKLWKFCNPNHSSQRIYLLAWAESQRLKAYYIIVRIGSSFIYIKCLLCYRLLYNESAMLKTLNLFGSPAQCDCDCFYPKWSPRSNTQMYPHGISCFNTWGRCVSFWTGKEDVVGLCQTKSHLRVLSKLNSIQYNCES